MRLRQKVAKAAVVAVLSASAVAYGALEKHVTVRVEGQLTRVGTFAGTVGEVLDRAHVQLGQKDLVRPPVTTPLHDGMLIEVRRAKPITLVFNGQPKQIIVTGLTVEEVIEEMHLRASLADYVGSPLAARITPGMVIVYRNAVGIRVEHDGISQQVITNAATVGQVLKELGVKLAGKDQISVPANTYPTAGLVVKVFRIGTRVEEIMEKVPYETETRDNVFLERGHHALLRSGRNGLARASYKVTYKNGKVISKQRIGAHIIRRPQSRLLAVGIGPHCICTRGTETGDGTWYRHSGLTAASPWLPFGTVVRVTNLENGRTVTVTINDRGPTGPGRIIDLSDKAFDHIASLSEGVIRVRIRW
jgi:resuscitation-promoting factor RpfB